MLDEVSISPAPPAWTLPAAAYRDQAIYAEERRRIFAANWSLFARADQLTKPGDYVAGTIAGYPILVVRDGDGRLGGFHNVCRHRAAMLAPEGTGRFNASIRCPYHQWAYTLDGGFKRAPGFDAAPGGLDPACLGLFPINVDQWRGLVFVRIATTGPSLLDWLGPIDAMAARYPLDRQRYFMEKSQEVAVDWKAYGENYLECYHCPGMHPGLCASLDIERYTIDVLDAGGLFHLYGPKRAGGMTEGLYFYRFPYLMLNLYEWGSSIATVEPLGAGRMRHVNWYLFADTSPEKAEANRASAEWSAQIVAEDIAMCLTVQRNLESGVYERGVLSPSKEHAVRGFQDMVRRGLGDALKEEA